ncbi:hypothetical protein ACHAQH_008078 [Verticillium albo-atrum]
MLSFLAAFPAIILSLHFTVAAVARLSNALPTLRARTYRKTQLSAANLYPVVPFKDDIPKHMQYVGSWFLLTAAMLAWPATRGSLPTLGLVLFWTGAAAWSRAKSGMKFRLPVMNAILGVLVFLIERVSQG